MFSDRKLSRRTILRNLLAGGAALSWPRALRAEGDTAGHFYTPAQFDSAMTADPGALDLHLAAGQLQGTLPEAIRGATYLSNGPARIRLGGQTLHPFDGHGYMRAFRFEADGGVRLRARYVRTPAFEAEDASGVVEYRGLGSMVAYPGERRWKRTNRKSPGPRNVANTTVYAWDGALMAGWEGGLPYALDPETLETRGPVTFGGALADDEMFLAHVKIDPAGRLVGLSPKMGPKTRLTFREFDPGVEAPVVQHVVDLDGAMMLHDFAITERYYVLASNPLTLEMGALVSAIRGAGPLISAIAADAEREGELLLISRADGSVRRIPLGRPVFVIHYANAFDDGGDVVVDACVFPTLEFGTEFGFNGPDQILDPSGIDAPETLLRIRASAGDTAALTEIGVRSVDFPRVHPGFEGRPYTRIYAAARSTPGGSYPFDALVAIDPADPQAPPQLWVAGRGRFVGEPVFAPVPGGGELDGSVVVAVYDGEKQQTSLCVFDPADIAAGPVAVAELPIMLPYGFHGGLLPAG